MFTTGKLFLNPDSMREKPKRKIHPSERGQLVRCVACAKLTRPLHLMPGQDTDEGVLCTDCYKDLVLEDL